MLPKGVRNPIPGGGQWAEEEGDGHPQRDNATTALMAHLPTAAAAASNKGKGSVLFCSVVFCCSVSVCGPIKCRHAETLEDCDLKAQSE